MSCGKDLSFLNELQFQLSIEEDLLKVARIITALQQIRLDIYEIVSGSFFTERLKLWDNIHLQVRVTTTVLQSIVKNLTGATDLDKKTKKKMSTIKELDKTCKEVRKTLEEFEEKMDQLEKLVKDTEAEWDVKIPDKAVLARMSKKERKELIEVWRDREKIAVKGRAEYEDLKAEWDSMKEGLGHKIMTCLGDSELEGVTLV